MRFGVPQFIEIEDKIFGPFTFKQFIYLAGGAGISFMLWNFIPIGFFAIILILPVAAFSIALAFYKVNSKPFIYTVEAAVKYMLAEKLYIWKKGAGKIIKGQDSGAAPEISYVPKLSDSKLKDLSWSLDVIDTTKKR
ncbi:MAG: PrgI family protein [Candidatus Paceibacterota bacterium]|jgi:hypothetical protein